MDAMGMPLPLLAVSVIQITNGFYFAKAPYSFTRPIYPEATGLMAAVANDSAWSTTDAVDAVSHTLSLGAAYDGKLHVRHRAFTDRTLRHENLLWLAEVVGERYACWSTSLFPYSDITSEDDRLATKYAQYLIPDAPVPGVYGTYYRAPAYFSSHASTTQLVCLASATTNLVTPLSAGMFQTGAQMAEYDESSVLEHGSLASLVGIGRVGARIPPPPSKGSPLSGSVFVQCAGELSTNLSRAAVFIPIENLVDMSVVSGDLRRVSYYVEEKSSDNWYSYFGNNPQIPSNAAVISSWDSGDTANTPVTYWTVTNGPGYSVTTNTDVIVSHASPSEPVSYRNLHRDVYEQTVLWDLWTSTQYKQQPWIALVVTNSASQAIPYMDTNKSVTVTETIVSGAVADAGAFEMFDKQTMTIGRTKTVMTICCVSPENGVYYFRTNTYNLSVARATGFDGSIRVDDGGAARFVSLVADVAFNYDVQYQGWEGQDAYPPTNWSRVQGSWKRAFVPIDLPTTLPLSDHARFEFRFDDVFRRVGDILISNICERIGANFNDEYAAYSGPAWWPSGSSMWTYEYAATRYLNYDYSISNLYVAANLNFTQATTNDAVTVYQVPGYAHLQTPGGTGEWIGPYTSQTSDLDEVFQTYRSAFSDLIGAQSAETPPDLVKKVYQYELVRIPNAVDFAELVFAQN